MKRAPTEKNADGRRPGKKRLMARTNDELFQQVKPEYEVGNGLRKVKPYYFEYQTYAKERWLGRTILDVFRKEFRDRPARYYQEAIRRRLITINGEPCDLDQRVESSDLIGHKLHRHEPPVTAQPIKILFQGEGRLVIDKPGSIPAHPSGRYRFNSLVEILRYDLGISHLSVINRLDRLTSGICILATDPMSAEKLHQQMEDRLLQKEYVARVLGEFPETADCTEPLLVVEHKLGLVAVDPVAGKPSHTIFERISTNGRESIVRCRPLTGRTHQIRVHLRHLGFPIANDQLYNNKIWAVAVPPTREQVQVIARTLLDETIEREGGAVERVLAEGEKSDCILCPECSMERPEPSSEQLCIYLHAVKYSCTDWSYETEFPAWAALDPA